MHSQKGATDRPSPAAGNGAHAAGPSADDASPPTTPTHTPPTHDALNALNALALDTETASTIGASQCSICMENDKDQLFLPCKHITCCAACTRNLKGRPPLCPLCRAPIAHVIGGVKF